MNSEFYAVLTEDGTMIDSDTDLQEAVLRAERHEPGDIFIDANCEARPAYTEPEALSAMRQNPRANPRSAALAAAKACRIPVTPVEKALQIDLSEARERVFASVEQTHSRILEAMDEEAKKFRAPGQKGSAAAEAKRSWLAWNQIFRQNQKLAKVLVGSDFEYDSRGLSLVPHSTAFRDPWVRSHQQLPSTFCLYSTDECRKTCLVNTGQRVLEDGAFALSYIFSQALRSDPEAFVRLMHEAALQAFTKLDGPAHRRFLRFNVLSDVPWEIVAPGLIESVCDEARYALGIRRWKREDGAMVYDYTKVPYREVSKQHYDLTFSFTGVENRMGQFDDVISSGGKVAVVFVRREMSATKLAPEQYRASPGKALTTPYKGERYYPWTFFEHAVFNGDASDIRALDPEGVQIIGLTYKVARYKVAARTSGKQFELKPFVPVGELDTQLPLFLVRVMQPDPEAPPVVVPTQDPALNRNLLVVD